MTITTKRRICQRILKVVRHPKIKENFHIISEEKDSIHTDINLNFQSVDVDNMKWNYSR